MEGGREKDGRVGECVGGRERGREGERDQPQPRSDTHAFLLPFVSICPRQPTQRLSLPSSSPLLSPAPPSAKFLPPPLASPSPQTTPESDRLRCLSQPTVRPYPPAPLTGVPGSEGPRSAPSASTSPGSSTSSTPPLLPLLSSSSLVPPSPVCQVVRGLVQLPQPPLRQAAPPPRA
jgi:hypothetical protein